VKRYMKYTGATPYKAGDGERVRERYYTPPCLQPHQTSPCLCLSTFIMLARRQRGSFTSLGTAYAVGACGAEVRLAGEGSLCPSAPSPTASAAPRSTTFRPPRPAG